jgi:two-component sensor histidine kinase
MSQSEQSSQTETPVRTPYAPKTIRAELEAALAREQILLRDKHEQSQRQVMMAQEFEHRLINSLQLIASLLSLQSRAATTPEGTAQLTIAANRVAALGRVHRRLHLLDHQDNVEFSRYLQLLCEDLSGLLLQAGIGSTIVVEGTEAAIPTKFAIPLGFVVNELVTNAAKYAEGNIIVRFDSISPGTYSLSVMDEGPGLPDDFKPADSRGLGMKIVNAQIRQIHGELQILPGDRGRGARFIVTFAMPQDDKP